MKRELDFRIINTDRHFAYVEITKQSHVGKGFNNGSDCLVMNYPDPTRQSRLISQVHPSYETLQNGACAFYVRGENAALDFRSIKIPLSKLSDFYNLVEKWLSIVDYPPVAVAVAKNVMLMVMVMLLMLMVIFLIVRIKLFVFVWMAKDTSLLKTGQIKLK